MRYIARCESCGAAFAVLLDPTLTSSGIRIYRWCRGCRADARQESWSVVRGLGKNLLEQRAAIDAALASSPERLAMWDASTAALGNSQQQ